MSNQLITLSQSPKNAAFTERGIKLNKYDGFILDTCTTSQSAPLCSGYAKLSLFATAQVFRLHIN